MEFIKYMDFFSIRFTFYTNNQPHNQTIFGGIMTFIYIICCILIIFFVSYDDLKRLHPITTLSEIPDSERKLVNLNKEKIYIPFRMVNYENKFIDHREILYIIPYLIEGRFNSEIGMDLKYTLLNYKLCNETSIVNRPDSYRIDVPLNQLFCIEENNFLFGGNWNHQFLNYIEINLYLCKDGIAFNSSDSRCSKITNYLNKVNTSLLFDFYFPMVQFQPKNINNPVEIIYKNYYYRLSSFSYKIEKLYLREHILSDDLNFFNSKYKNNSYWGKSALFSDDYFLPSDYDPISDNSNTSRIFALNIYMDDGLVYYTRTFKKFFIIMSDFFPLFKILLFFLKKFTQHIKMTLTKRRLIELIFENKKRPKKLSKMQLFTKKNQLKALSKKNDDELIIKQNALDNSEYNNLNNLNNNSTIIKKNFNEHKENNMENNNIVHNNRRNVNNNINRSIISSKNEENNSKAKSKSSLPLKNINDSPIIEIPIFERMHKKNIKSHSFRHTKYLFPFYYYFLDIIFDNLVNPHKFFNLSKKYFTVYNFMCQVYDISSHVILIKQFNILKNILKEKMFEDKGMFLSKLYGKININDNKVLDTLRNEFKHNKSLNFRNIS